MKRGDTTRCSCNRDEIYSSSSSRSGPGVGGGGGSGGGRLELVNVVIGGACLRSKVGVVWVLWRL